MFILVEGLLNVVILDAGETEVKVAQLRPGAWFGELSLLTGEPRSASIQAAGDSFLFEIPKAVIDPILRAKPSMAEVFSRKIAENKLKNEAVSSSRSPEEHEEKKQAMSSRILGMIKSFFNLG